MNVIKEHFDSIHQMLSVIDSRPNNSIMAGKYSSHDSGKDFTGTDSYEEAKWLFENGYTEILPEIKHGISVNYEKSQTALRRTVRTGVVGYTPHVPNAIMGLPNSMIYMDKVPQKTKTVSIVVSITESGSVEAKEFVKSGITTISVVNALELRGYRCELKVDFFDGEEGDEMTFATVKVKDYREHMDLQKLCFPLAHPSMFRRFGFKWLETVPGLTKSGWSFGYGRTVKNYQKFKKHFMKENEFLIDLKLTKKYNYDPEKIIEVMNLK